MQYPVKIKMSNGVDKEFWLSDQKLRFGGGGGGEVTPAEKNWQLLANVVLESEGNFSMELPAKMEKVYLYISQRQVETKTTGTIRVILNNTAVNKNDMTFQSGIYATSTSSNFCFIFEAFGLFAKSTSYTGNDMSNFASYDAYTKIYSNQGESEVQNYATDYFENIRTTNFALPAGTRVIVMGVRKA